MSKFNSYCDTGLKISCICVPRGTSFCTSSVHTGLYPKKWRIFKEEKEVQATVANRDISPLRTLSPPSTQRLLSQASPTLRNSDKAGLLAKSSPEPRKLSNAGLISKT